MTLILEKSSLAPSFPDIRTGADDWRRSGKRWAEAQRRRRSYILSHTREAISRGGVSELSMRALAAECGVAAQTLYNLFGGRSNIICSSLKDYISYICDLSKEKCTCPNPVMGVAEVAYMCVINSPSYMNYSTLAYFGEEKEVSQEIKAAYVSFLRKSLGDMSVAGHLKPGMDLAVTADNVFSIYAVTTYEWCRGHIGPQDFYIQMIHRIQGALGGYLLRPHAEEMWAWAQGALQHLPADGGSPRLS